VVTTLLAAIMSLPVTNQSSTMRPHSRQRSTLRDYVAAIGCGAVGFWQRSWAAANPMGGCSEFVQSDEQRVTRSPTLESGRHETKEFAAKRNLTRPFAGDDARQLDAGESSTDFNLPQLSPPVTPVADLLETLASVKKSGYQGLFDSPSLINSGTESRSMSGFLQRASTSRRSHHPTTALTDVSNLLQSLPRQPSLKSVNTTLNMKVVSVETPSTFGTATFTSLAPALRTRVGSYLSASDATNADATCTALYTDARTRLGATTLQLHAGTAKIDVADRLSALLRTAATHVAAFRSAEGTTTVTAPCGDERLVHLPSFANIRTLDLERASIGPLGAVAVAAAIERGLFPNLTTLNAGLNRAGSSGVTALTKALTRAADGRIAGQITELNLWDNGAGVEGFVAVAEALPQFTALRKLDLGWNDAGPAGLRALASALRQGAAPELRELNLRSNCALEEGIKALATALIDEQIPGTQQRPLEKLVLSNNVAGVAGAEAVARALEYCLPKLREFDFSGNGAQAQGLKAIGRALRAAQAPHGLRAIAVDANNGGEAGIGTLLRSLNGGYQPSIERFSVSDNGLERREIMRLGAQLQAGNSCPQLVAF